MNTIVKKSLSALAAAALTACGTLPVTFQKEKAYEIAFSSVREGKFGQLMNDYFAMVMPLAAEHGGRMAATFRLEPPAPAAIPAQRGAFFEWPSVDAFARATQDKRIGALLPVRNDALSNLNEANFFTVDRDTTVSFDTGRSYDIVGVNAAAAEAQRGKPGVLLVLRATNPPIGPFRPEAVLVVEAGQAAGEGAAARVRVRFNPAAQ